jgi:hypothetical protein
MKVGRQYMHVNNRSVFIEVIRSFYVPEKKLWKVKVMWWKYHSKWKLRFPMGITTKFEVTETSHPHWRPLNMTEEQAHELLLSWR